MTWDYVVVGSGLSALAFSSLAAKAGRRVLVLETHHLPGGYGHTFTMGRKDQEVHFNAQLHYVWNCGPGRPVNNFLRKLGLQDEVTFESYDPDGYDRMRMPGYSLDVPYDWQELGRRLSALFPDAVTSITAFLDEVQATDTALSHGRLPRTLSELPDAAGGAARLLRWRKATLQDVFDHFDLPPAAQTLIALQWPDFLLPPDRLSFFAWAMLFAGYQRGAYYPTHHFESVVQALVRVIEGNGEVRLGQRVTKFLHEGGRVVGVEVEPVDEQFAASGPPIEVRGAEVICNMDPRRAAEMLGWDRFSAKVQRKLDYTYSPSNFMAYVALKDIDLRDHGFGRNNLFHTETDDLNVAFDRMLAGDYSQPSFAMTVPSLLTPDRSDAPEGTTIVELLTVADYTLFHDLKLSSPRAYGRKKQEIYDAMVDIIERDYVPGFRDHVAVRVLGSPTTNQRFVGSPAGNSYGSDLTPDHIGLGRLDHRTSIDGLHFCNASAGFAGFSGTLWTGSRLYEHLMGDPVQSGPHVLPRE
jgi:all-trans-retinol 13,14-reductase